MSPPEHDPATHRAEELAPARDGEAWVQRWRVVELNAEELAELRARLLAAVRDEAQRRLDAFAQSRRYDGIISLASYATSKDPAHAAEGQRGVDVRDAVWGVLKAIEADVLAGARPMPTFDEAMGELPELTWS